VYTAPAKQRQLNALSKGTLAHAHKRLEAGYQNALLDGRKEVILTLLGQGKTPDEVSQITRIHIGAVRRIRDENPECIAHLRNSLARILGEARM
jgi:hypothetical protein